MAEPTAGRLGLLQRLAVQFLLGCFAALCCDGLRWDTPTVDEFAHLPAGYFYLLTGRFELFPLNPPLIKVLCALPLLLLRPAIDTAAHVVNTGWYPWFFGTDFMQRNRAIYDAIFQLGRLPVVLLGVFAGWVVWRWAQELYGKTGGFVALILFCFCPSFIAHAHLVTPDAGTAAFFAAALWTAWRLLRQPSWGRLTLAILALGAAELSKFSALLLYPLLVVLALAALVLGRRFALPGLGTSNAALTSLLTVALLFLGSLVVVNSGYLWEGVGQPVGQVVFQSHALQRATSLLPRAVPLPLPSSYLAGLDALQLINEKGEFPTYLFGRLLPSGSRFYYSVAFFFKTPLTMLGLFALALFAGAPGEESVRRRQRALDEAFVWFPAVALFIVLSLGSKVQYGIRYVLPVLPLACVYAGRLAPLIQRRSRVGLLAVALLALYPLSAVLTTPDSLAYFNVCAGARPDRILLETNLDWGQGLKRVRRAMERMGKTEIALAYFGHVDPELYGIRWHFPDPRQPGPVAVSANFLDGYPYATYAGGRIVLVPANAFTWINRSRRVADLGGGMALYEVP
jgi:Dolichyl-phosphate-mannose-protein mannosyltransferase